MDDLWLSRLTPRQKRTLAVRPNPRPVLVVRRQVLSGSEHRPRHCRLPQVVLITGGVGGLKALRTSLAAARLEQNTLCLGLEQNAKRMRAPKVAVDAVFAKRLSKILAM